MAISVDTMPPEYRDIDRGGTYRRRLRVRKLSLVTWQVSRQHEDDFRHQLCLHRRRRKSRYAVLVCPSLDKEIRNSKPHHAMVTGGLRIMPLSLAENTESRHFTSGYRIRDAPRWTNRFIHRWPSTKCEGCGVPRIRIERLDRNQKKKKKARKGKRRRKEKKPMSGVGAGLCFASVASHILSRSLSAREWRACVDISGRERRHKIRCFDPPLSKLLCFALPFLCLLV